MVSQLKKVMRTHNLLLSEQESQLQMQWSWLRFKLHLSFKKLIQLENPYQHWFQTTFRSPILDFIMQRLTLVGSTTSFIIMVPFMFLLGGQLTNFAFHFTLLMCISVYITNFFKDLLCLPRPSFPVERIDLIAKHSKEFGLPSCHTFLAIALGRLTLVVFSPLILASSVPLITWLSHWILIGFLFTIIVSRIYCGMHSFTDILSGLILGWFTGGLYIILVPWLDNLFSSINHLSCLFFTIGLSFLLIGLFHPNPAWPGCPCYKDSLRVVGVMIGICLAKVNLVIYPLGSKLGAPISIQSLVARCFICVGVLAIFDLFLFKRIQLFLEPFFHPPKKHVMGHPFYLDRISFVTIGEVLKFFGIALLASNLVPRTIYHLGI